MTELVRWTRTHPLQRNLLLGVGVLALTLGLAAVFGASVRSGSRPQPLATATTTIDPQPTPLSSAPADQAGQAFLEARPVAAAFLEAYASYRWNEPAQAQRERLQPYVTPRLAVELAVNSGASVARADQAGQHQVAAGQVLELAPLQLTSDGRLSVAATVSQHMSSDEGEHQIAVSLSLTLVREPEGWRVDQVQP